MPRKAGNRRTRPKGPQRSPSLGSHREEISRNSPDDTPPSDYEYFQLSDTPEEDFGEADREWPVKAIVGEEILQNREIRYQVEWEGWSREDGTTTTWTKGLNGAADLLDAWDDARAQERLEKAAKGPSIDLEELDKYKPHQFRTFESNVAYHEKLRKWKLPALWKEWLEMDLDGDREDGARVKEEPRASAVPESSRKRKRTESVASSSHASSSRLCDSEFTRVGSSTAGSSGSNTVPRSSTSRTHQSRPQSQAPSRSQPPPSTAPHRQPRSQTQPSSCIQLQRKWSQLIRETGAERISIVNEVDDEECPVLPPGFEYLENSCTYDVDVQDPRSEDNKGFMLCCECEDGCVDPMTCSCLEESQCVDVDENMTAAYDDEGHFLFNHGREVVECNENCACKANCSNSVAQKPRSVPIEVFKTKKNGWGARSPVRIPKGTVLGFYTGKIMKRKQLARIPADEREYSFDLDIRDDDETLPHYSVCAYREGNWTRFVNHSCNPNCIVYSMVYDLPREVNMPYIVLVASETIPALKELTIDYNPSAARELEAAATGRKKRGRKKGKGRVKIEEVDDEDAVMFDAEGRTKCFCGSTKCRGFI